MLKAPSKNTYDLLIIFKPSLGDDELEGAIVQIETAIKNYGGSIVRTEKPFRSRFTHRIKTIKEGFYVTVLFSSSPELPNLLKRTLSISDDVLRYMITRKENVK